MIKKFFSKKVLINIFACLVGSCLGIFLVYLAYDGKSVLFVFFLFIFGPGLLLVSDFYSKKNIFKKKENSNYLHNKDLEKLKWVSDLHREMGKYELP